MIAPSSAVVNPFDQFNQTFVINLDRRPDRLERVTKHLQEFGVKTFQRVSAVDGMNEEDELSRRVVRHSSKKPPQTITCWQRGTLGCLKSHLKALELAQETLSKNEKQKALILEDDCVFIDNAASMLKKSLSELPNDWEVLMLGAIYARAPGYVLGAQSVMRVWEARAAHAYVVNPQSCTLLINRIRTLLESETIIPFDEMFVLYQPHEAWYAAHPLIAWQLSGDMSDIEGEIRAYTKSCYKVGVEITYKVWLWLELRPYLASLASSVQTIAISVFSRFCGFFLKQSRNFQYLGNSHIKDEA